MNFKKLVKPYFKSEMQSLGELVSINSIYDETTVSEKTPYGKGVNDALNYMADLGKLYGFDVDMCDGRGVELSYGDNGPLISIFAHLDVVPVSNDWKHPPFALSYDDKEKMLYGRGVADDKGPAIAAFYAVKALKDNDLLNNVRIKLFYGGDEERGSSCLHYYFNVLKKEAPKYGFTPDSAFPLIYGEKGITTFKLHKDISLGDIVKIECGTVSNIVPDKATFYLKNKDDIKSIFDNNKIHYEIDGEFIKYISLGKAAHGSVPEYGSNAFINGLETLIQLIDNEYLKTLYNALKDPFGKGFDGYCYSEHLKHTTYNVGLASYDGKHLELTVNFRYPENAPAKELILKLANVLSMKEEYKEIGNHLLFDPNSNFVKTLLQAYKKEMPLFTKVTPLTTGGGTYAKEAMNTIAFGSEFPGHNYHMHENDECYPVKDFKLATAIYARAIYMLSKLG